MTVETVGSKLKQARLAKKLEIDEVAEATKIRPDRIIDLEADEYVHFPNIAYAKSFLINYSKFLQVDIREDLENFQISRSISLGDYQYLVSPPAPRSSSESRRFQPRGFRVPPLIVTILILIVLVGIPLFSYLAVNVSRLKAGSPAIATGGEMDKKPPELVATPNLTRLDSPEPLAPIRSDRQVANEGTSSSPVEVARLDGPASYASRGREDSGTEVRRAQPVVPILPTTEKTTRPIPVPGADLTPRLEITPLPDKKLEVHALRKTWVKVTRDEEGALPVYEGYAGPEKSITVVGKRFWVRVRDKSAVELRKDGQLVLSSSDDIVIN
jgi:cytoskeletal protein RodZ